MHFRFFLRYLFSRQTGTLIRSISWLCLLGVATGVMAMIVVLSVMNGFGDNLKNRLLSIEPHILFYEDEKIDDLVDQFKKEPNTRAFYFEQQDLLLKTSDGIYTGAIAKGLDETEIIKLFNELNTVVNEESLEGLDKYEIVMGFELARSMNVIEGDSVVAIAPESILLPPGELPRFAKVRVKRLFRSKNSKFNSKFILYNQEKTFKVLGKTKSFVKGVQVMLDDPEQYKFYLDKYDSYKSESWASRNSSLLYSLKMEKLMMTIFLGLTLLIGSFSIITVLVLLGVQKKTDIGILMSMGMSLRRTQGLITKIGLLLSLSGMLIGLILGIGVCFLLEGNLAISLPDIYYDDRIPIKLDYQGIFLVLCLSGFVSIISSFVPSYISSSGSPSDCLKSH